MRIRRFTVTVAATAVTVLAIGTNAASAATYTNPAPIALPALGNANPYPSQITVTGQTAPISDLNVILNGFSPDSPRDLDGPVLVGPAGQALLLSGCVGQNDFDPPTTNVTLKFDDSSGILLPAHPGFLTGGTYKPTNRCAPGPDTPIFESPGPLTYSNPGPAGGGAATLAQIFNGTSANGTWSLFVAAGRVGSDPPPGPGTGQIAGGWSLEISADPATTPKKKKKKCKKKKKKKGEAAAKKKCKKKKKKKEEEEE